MMRTAFRFFRQTRLLLLVCAATVAASAQATSPAARQASIRFAVENPALQPSMYSLEIHEDGTGIYREMLSSASGPAVPVERPLHIHQPLLSHLFQEVQPGQFFTEGCQPSSGRVAFTGKKTLSYAGPAGEGSCTFNYSREKAMNEVANQLSAVAFTMQEGLRLSREQRYDRLGLYDELNSLCDAAQDRRALELENIAPELQAIATDGAVMNLARARARALLSAPEATR